MFPAFSCSQAGRAQCWKKAHQLQEIPLLKKWGWDERPASPGHHSKDLLWSNPTQPPAKLRQAEEARKRRKCSSHPGGTGVSSVQLCRGPQSYCHCETRSRIAASHSCRFRQLSPHGYLCWQMPTTWVPSPALLSLPSVGLGSTWQQPRPQWLDACRMLACSQPSLPGRPLTSALPVAHLLPAALTSLASPPHVWSQRSYSCLSACWQPPQLLGSLHSLLSLVPGFVPLDSTTAELPARGKGWGQLQAHLRLWGPWCTLVAAASLHMLRTVQAGAGNQTRGEQMQLEGLAAGGGGLERRQGGRMWCHKQLSMPLVIGMHTCGYRVSLQAGIGGKGCVCVCVCVCVCIYYCILVA